MATHVRGLLDTSVVIDLDTLPAELLPDRILISAITVAELGQGPLATDDAMERASRQDRLQRVANTFAVLPFDVEAARAHGLAYAAVRVAGNPRGRINDLYIAAVALANNLPLYTRKPDDFRGLEDLVTVVPV